MSKIKTLILSNGELKEKEINNTLEELQKIVGGYIEIPYLSKVFTKNEIDVIINEEGKFIEELKPEIAIIDGENEQLLDTVYGNCIFASHDKEGNTTSLNAEQIKIIEKELGIELKLMNPKTAEIFKVRALFI